MEEIRVSFPKELKVEIEQHPEIDWSAIFKKAAVNYPRAKATGRHKSSVI